MRAAVSAVLTIEHDSLADVRFENPSDAACWVRAIAGAEGGDGEESFDVFVCTPGWLARTIAEDGPVVASHHLVVDRWEATRVAAAVRDAIESESAGSWAELGERISRFALWEFHAYRPAPGHGRADS